MRLRAVSVALQKRQIMLKTRAVYIRGLGINWMSDSVFMFCDMQASGWRTEDMDRAQCGRLTAMCAQV
jgi:hypothetical protein